MAPSVRLNAARSSATASSFAADELVWIDDRRQLDQEEALAYVLAALLGHQLLPEEARSIGEQARYATLAFKGRPPRAKKVPKLKKVPADQQLKDAACDRKSKAKQAAAKDVTLAEGLAEKLADIDAVLATERRQLARAEVSLEWPARNSVIATRAPPKPQAPASKLKQLRQKVALLEETLRGAEADSVAARRVAERCRDLAREMEGITRQEALHGDLGDEAWAALEAQRNHFQDAALEAQREYHAALRWLQELRDGVEDAREAVRDEEDAQAEARRAEAAATGVRARACCRTERDR